MADRSSRRAPRGRKASEAFTDEERAAMREASRERRRPTADGEADVLAKFAEMPDADRAIAERIHTLIREHAPDLTPRTWYGMPAYTKNDKVVCHFQPAQKFKTRYATFGFSDKAALDDGTMWPVAFALTSLTAADEERLVALIKQAVS